MTGGITAEASRLLLAQYATGIGGRDAALLVMAKRHGGDPFSSTTRKLAKVAKSMGLKVATDIALDCAWRLSSSLDPVFKVPREKWAES